MVERASNLISIIIIMNKTAGIIITVVVVAVGVIALIAGSGDDQTQAPSPGYGEQPTQPEVQDTEESSQTSPDQQTQQGSTLDYNSQEPTTPAEPETSTDETERDGTTAIDNTEEDTTTSEQDSVSDGDQVIDMTVGNLFYDPTSASAQVGQEVTVNMDVSGTHTFTIDELGVDKRISSGQETVTFAPDQSGTYTYYCTIHGEGAMSGTLTVRQ